MGSPIIAGLNPAQLKAVTTTEGYVEVIAGAGSGKTRALTHRYAYLVSELGILPENIMCVTFTNKAANEMKRRVHRLIGDMDTAYINTFHGFCVSVLSEEANAIHYPQKFLVLDNSDINSMLAMIYEERHLTSRDMTFKDARDMIEIKKTIEQPEYYRDIIDMSIEALYEKYAAAVDVKDIIFLGYLYQQKKCFGLDYNDLIILTLHIFSEDKDICLKWQMKMEYIMVDEFQDIDPLQYRLMEVLCGYHKNLFVVGDPDQTIYTWRGANVRYILDLKRHFPGTEVIMMNDNYRSTPEILAAANSLISLNKDRVKKDLTPKRDRGLPVLYFHGQDSYGEADWICSQITEMLHNGEKPGDICILVRAHYLTAPIEKVFIERKLPYRIYSGAQFFERLEIKAALSYLRMIAYKDDLSFAQTVNTPKRNFGKSRMEYLKECAGNDNSSLFETLKGHIEDEKFRGTKAAEYVAMVDEMGSCADGTAVSELLSKVLDRSGYEEALRTEGDQERLDNLAELKQLVYDYEVTCGEEADLVHFLEHAALYTNSDTPDDVQKVKIMTIHAAKGLEFKHVFICGLSEGILPSKKSKTIQALEEERRLCFVAFTRAKDSLCLSDSGGSVGYEYRYPSRFILELDVNVVQHVVPLDSDTIAGARIQINWTNRSMKGVEGPRPLEVNARVSHGVFGSGIVLEADADAGTYLVKFDSMPTARKIAADKLKAD